MGIRPTRVRRLRIRHAIGHTTLAVAALAVGSLYLAVEKNVTLVLDGSPAPVRTLSANVGELLDARGIVLDVAGHVEPPPGTPLSDGMTVVVDTDGSTSSLLRVSQGVGVWVVEGSGPSAKLAVELTERGFSAGAPVEPTRIVDARVVVKGKTHDVLTNATTVRELLSAMGIRADRSDRVLPPPSTPLIDGERVLYVDIDVRIKEVMVPVPFSTYTTFSTELTPGLVRIEHWGQPGSMIVVYRLKRVDGEVVRRVVLSRHVTRSAVPQRRVVGRLDAKIHGTETGEASWYSFAPGSGFTAAHPWLPFGTIVTVTYLATGESIDVVINDRGPFVGRVIDLSDQAFAALAPLGQGVMDVRLSW